MSNPEPNPSVIPQQEAAVQQTGDVVVPFEQRMLEKTVADV
mgnify:CR=1 FL=1